MMNAFDETCLIEIQEDHVGHNNDSIPNIVKHLYKNYGKVKDADLLSNKETIRKY